MLKRAILSISVVGLLAAPPTMAADADAVAVEAASSLAPNQFVWTDRASTQPVSVVVSIADQRAYVYRGDTLVAASSVSTGKDDKPTPTGTYTILQKNRDHKSNLYNSAPMPFMQRLTWDGIAIHAGRNPGFPASHGCIRVPTSFAKKLFAATALGTTVTVTDESIDPLSPPPAPIPAEDAGVVAKANMSQLIAAR